MGYKSKKRKLQERLKSYFRLGMFVLVALFAVAFGSSAVLAQPAPPPPAQTQTLDQAVTAACGIITGFCTAGFTATSSSSPTALTRQTSPVEERRVPRLVGSLSPWFSGEYERFDKNVTKFEPGYKTDAGRASIGADYAFNDHRFVFGGAFTYAKIKGNFNSGGRLDTDSYGSLIYATIVPVPKSFIDVTAGYARKNYFLSRITVVRGPSGDPAEPEITQMGTSSGNPNGNEFTIGADGGYDFTFNNITIGPRLALHYKRNEIDGYRERGSGLNLIYDRQTQNSLTGGLGLYGSVAISTSFGVLVPQATLKYVHEFENSQRRIKFRVAVPDDDFEDADPNQRFGFRNDSPDRNYFQAGAGIAVVLPHDIQPFINYRALLGYSNQSSHVVTAGLRVAF